MKKWFKTLKEAKAYLKNFKCSDPYGTLDYRIFKSPTRKTKPYFIGTYLDWLQY